MKIVLAYEANNNNPSNYILWYLSFDKNYLLERVSSITKEKLILDLFNIETKKLNEEWFVWDQRLEQPNQIEIIDFIAKNTEDKTHLGKIPSLKEYQDVLDKLDKRVDFKSLN
jgi:hypothetical protein